MFLVPATLADARGIATVHVRGWNAAYDGIVPRATLDTFTVDRREAAWRTALVRGDSEVLVVKNADGAGIAGFVSFGRCRDEGAPPSRGELWALYVDPSRWGQGIGRRSWREARARLVARGYTEASVWVLEANTRALAFYAAEGFRVGAETTKDITIGGASLREVRRLAQLLPAP